MADREETELIAELKKLGRLLDSDTETVPEKPEETTGGFSPETAPASDSVGGHPAEPPQENPSLETVDMFDSGTVTASSHMPPAHTLTGTETLPEEPQSPETDAPARAQPDVLRPDPPQPGPATSQPASSDVGLDPDTIDELCVELVNLVVKTLSHRSGETLDETLRDKLHAEMGHQLRNWLIRD